MDLLLRILLIALYPMFLVARLFDAMRGRDPLQLREPEGSCWVTRGPSPSPRSYFVEGDVRMRRTKRMRLLTRLSRAFAPPAAVDGADRTRRNNLPAELPDEVYTLW